MKINELQLDEIERLSKSDYRGGKNSLYTDNSVKKFKQLPGGSGLLYTIESGRDEPTIKLWDPNSQTADAKPKKSPYEFSDEYKERLRAWEKRQASGKKIPQLIGKLTLEHPWKFPLKGALQVGTITVDEDYRGIGLAKALYGIALTILKRPLLAGSSQTPGGRRNWVSLSQIPGVEMKGYIAVPDYEIDPSASRDRYAAKDRETNIDTIMGKLGGQYIGNERGTHFFAFDVQPNTTGKELEAYVKQKTASVYGGQTSFEGGLFAVWTGQV
jgi:ribosomal protein S18 acetylase RimI-like enzyme